MSSEDKELLARIGQLAGQINRHKSQKAVHGPDPGRTGISDSYNHRKHRYASAPYPSRSYRPARQTAPHRHRTLNLNQSTTEGSAAENPGWVSKTDRHRQLINADVYEKDRENRSKALAATRDRKLKQKRHLEKRRFNTFLTRHAVAAPSSTTPVAVPTNAASDRNEIVIEGIRFVVLDGGKKLAKVTDDISAVTPTPKSATVAGVKFHRTKTGNLVANRVVQEHRRLGLTHKSDKTCRVFSTTGSCPKGPSCRHLHDPTKVALCKNMLKDKRCPHGDACDLSHDFSPERTPNCLHYAKGHCTNIDCVFTHSKASPSAPVCEAFGILGFCEKGAECTERHVFECPDFSNTGRCKTKGCKLLHRERASVLRNLAKPDEEMEDVSSDDDVADSDDVDSDAVAEYIEAESDDSDLEDGQDFIPL